MVISSVNAPVKKGGAGGAYTWGSPTDVSYLEGSPVSSVVGASGVTVMPTGVALAPAPQVVQAAPVQTFATNLKDTSAFPSLGGTTTMSAAPAVTSWGPSTLAPRPAVVLAETNLRTGAREIVDSQHPRNLFAKKPTVRPATEIQATTVQQGQIDWSQAGLPDAVVKSILTANQGASHLGPYAQAAPSSVPLNVLRPQAAFTQQQFKATKPAVVMKPKMQQPIIQPMKR